MKPLLVILTLCAPTIAWSRSCVIDKRPIEAIVQEAAESAAIVALGRESRKYGIIVLTAVWKGPHEPNLRIQTNERDRLPSGEYVIIAYRDITGFYAPSLCQSVAPGEIKRILIEKYGSPQQIHAIWGAGDALLYSTLFLVLVGLNLLLYRYTIPRENRENGA